MFNNTIIRALSNRGWAVGFFDGEEYLSIVENWSDAPTSEKERFLRDLEEVKHL